MASDKTRKNEPGDAGAKPDASGAPGQDVYDIRRIRRLVELMKEHDLNQIDLRQGDTRIQLQRGAYVPTDQAARPGPGSLTSGQASLTPVAPAPPPPPVEENIVLIKSPMVGTFYAAPDPDSPAYVKVGDHVGPETTVCIVEAMKVFNEIPAETSGKVLKVMVENGEPVEFGQPLFKVDMRG
jgi:acetyl-CoA carboxylase biotin carboxyl carrier protein